MSYLPCGTYFENYADDQKWWRTPFIQGKMILMIIVPLAIFNRYQAQAAERRA